ncbi:hypothetical protein BGZ63DRAFT_374373 [Mariannaea sp. PMI_226]|nr:hypothetical protein BGZ63DRAFT_374373 [Mariannaea sp. PMI_226]
MEMRYMTTHLSSYLFGVRSQLYLGCHLGRNRSHRTMGSQGTCVLINTMYTSAATQGAPLALAYITQGPTFLTSLGCPHEKGRGQEGKRKRKDKKKERRIDPSRIHSAPELRRQKSKSYLHTLPAYLPLGSYSGIDRDLTWAVSVFPSFFIIITKAVIMMSGLWAHLYRLLRTLPYYPTLPHASGWRRLLVKLACMHTLSNLTWTYVPRQGTCEAGKDT